MDKIKIGVVGAGAVGGVIGSLLAEKGYDVELAKRYNSAITLDEYTAIEITGAFGNRNILVKSVNGVTNFTSKKDVIFVLTKAHDAPKVVEQCLNFLNPGGIIVSSQNVMNVEDMLKVVGQDKLFGLIINWSANKVNKAKIDVVKEGNMVIGSFGNNSDSYLEILQRVLSSIAPTEISHNIIGDIWCRTIINSCISSVGALTGVSLGKFMLMPTTHTIFTRIIREAMSLAQALNVKVKNYGSLNYYEFIKHGIGPYFARKKMYRYMCRQNARFVSSCQRAIENNTESEIDYLNGYFVKMANKLNMSVPTNKRIYDMIKEIERGERSMMVENLLDYYLRHPKKYLKVVNVNKGE